MISTRLQTVFAALVLVGALTAPANTAEVARDPSTKREFIAKMLMCGQCHGQNGTPVRPAIPIIWGQEKNYLLKQMQDFRSKDSRRRADDLGVNNPP